MNDETVSRWLGGSELHSAWVRELDHAGPPSSDVVPPTDSALADLADRLGIKTADATALAATRPVASRDPELWWLLQRSHQVLITRLDDVDRGLVGPRAPDLPAELGVMGRYFHAHVLLTAVPAVRRWQTERGLPDDVCWATLADLGRKMDIYRKTHGVGGLDAQHWLSLHFRGLIFQLGRLQFNRGRTLTSNPQLAAAGAPFGQGDYSLSIHIPETGPLTASACDRSLRWAQRYFGRHFPEESYDYAICSSWLLDPQLAEYLADQSNIIGFQRRFALTPQRQPGDGDIFQLVFHRTDPSLEDLPQRTTLERSLVHHLQAGKHWNVRFGWLKLAS